MTGGWDEDRIHDDDDDSLEDEPSMGLDTDIDQSIAEDPPLYEQVHVNQQLPVQEMICL